jgi:transmembrane sensor
MSETNHIYTLITKVISGNAEAKDASQLEKWLAESENNQKNYDKNVKVWQVAETWLAPQDIQQDKLKIVNAVNHCLIIGVRKNKRRSMIYLAAAILAFPIAIALSFLFYRSPMSANIDQTVCEISAPAGHLSKCILPDGTEVWVNSGSKIKYDTNGFTEELREVLLDGEAYFEVTKNKKRPFYVRTKLADVKVTGTSFDVKAYSCSGSFETVLSEGSIELEFNNKFKSEKMKLKPGERAVWDEDQKKPIVEHVNTRIYSAWRNGEIIFQDATLNDLIEELERIYDVKFKLSDPGLGNYRFRGTFSYDNNLIDALEKFKVTAHIDYYIKNKKVWLSKTNQ